MHAFTHSLAHRAPSATRPRVRWQPYNSLSSQTSSSLSSQSPSSHCSTPSSSLSSPPSSTPNPNSKPTLHTQNPKETPSRDSSKKQFAIGLVDQAVKTLGEIWRPQDIPSSFHLFPRTGGAAIGGLPDTSAAINPSGDIHVPIKGFVHEVIRRSRTSGCVLQTALCYLEAVRPIIPDLARKEKACEGSTGKQEICRVAPATDAELTLEEQYLQMGDPSPDIVGNSALSCLGLQSSDSSQSSVDHTVSTVRISDIEEDISPSEFSVTSSPDHVPLSNCLPSPLLCPRRTFLASLILASKFTQDKCYSNRAWAKLSGLPAREIGRCERALGEALEWRLWVGKTPAQPSSTSGLTTNPSIGRPVVRSQSEGNIFNATTTRSPFLVRQDPRPPVTCINPQRMLQRSSTMPAEVFANSAKVDVRSDVSIQGHAKSYLNSIAPTASSSPLHFKQSQEQLDYQLAPASAHIPASYVDMACQSPSPDNPGLSYSPSSTESSSGERTVQMSTFIDEPTAMYSVSQPPTAMDFWPCSGNGDSLKRRTSPLLFMKNREMALLNPIGSLAPPPGEECLQPFSFAVSLSNPPWVSEGEVPQPLPVQLMVGQVM